LANKTAKFSALDIESLDSDKRLSVESGNLPRLIPSPVERAVYQETSFSVDAVARNVCSTWEEATSNPNFDAVVIGSGMFGGYCAAKLFRPDELFGADEDERFRLAKAKCKRTLLLEAGGFLVAEHYQNLPEIGLEVPDPIDPASDSGPRKLVWGMPWRGNTRFVGTPYCVGGKSVYWGGWCPRLTNGTLATWPRSVAEYLNDNYHLLEEQLGVSESTDFIQGQLYQAMMDKAKEVLPTITGLIHVECPPLAVLGLPPASGLLAFDKYSSLPLLISAIRDAIEEVGNDDGRRRLFLVPKAHVVKLHTSGTLIKRIACIEVFVNGQQRFLKIEPECAVVLALGAIESTRIALESFPTTPNPKYEKMGRNLTVHMRSNTTVQIKRSAFETPGKPLRDKLQTAALLVRGETGDGHFHLQVTAADDPNGDPDKFLFSMIPDIDQLKKIRDQLKKIRSQHADFVSVTFRGCAETKGDKKQPIRNPALRWIDLSPERDEFGFRRAFVNLVINESELRLWNDMDAATVELAHKLANNDNTAIVCISSERDGLGTTYHESGTLWMGNDDDPATSVTNTNGRFHHIVNAYCVDQALFPTVGSANPALTGLTLTRKIAEHIARL
jgi:hypothetical protein